MDNKILKKWGCLVVFLILMGISCWATEHSFHLLINWMPQTFVWGLTIAFFVLASYGTKLIVDALNYDVYQEHRRRNFWLGIVVVLVFWLFMSMPTNTHTFFYNHKIGGVVLEDLHQTKNYLQQIKESKNIPEEKKDHWEKVKDEVNERFQALSSEYNGINVRGKRGNGEYVREKINEINALLDKESTQGPRIEFDPRMYSTDPRILSKYEKQKQAALNYIENKLLRVPETEKDNAKEIIRQIDLMADTLYCMVQVGKIYEDVITQSEGVVMSGYTCIKNNKEYVVFQSEADEEQYTAENLETRIKRMLSVIDVWIDFCKGKYPLSFLFYVLVSILVDVAAFAFFDFAFKKEE